MPLIGERPETDTGSWRTSSHSGAAGDTACVQVKVVTGRHAGGGVPSRPASTPAGAPSGPWATPTRDLARSRTFPGSRPTTAAPGRGRHSVTAEQTYGGLVAAAGHAVSRADIVLKREAITVWPIPAPDVGRYRLTVIESLAQALVTDLVGSPGRLAAVGGGGHTSRIGATEPARGHLGIPPADWRPVSSWHDLIGEITRGGSGTAAFAVIGRGRSHHAITLVHTRDRGVVIIRPTRPPTVDDSGYETVPLGTPDRPEQPPEPVLAELGPLYHIRVAVFTPAPGIAAASPPPVPPGIPLGRAPAASSSTASAITDAVDPRIGMPASATGRGDIVDRWKTESKLTRTARSAELKNIDRALHQWQTGGRLTPDRFDLNERQLWDVQDEISQWRLVKAGRTSGRTAAIDSLEQRIRQEIRAVAERRRAAAGRPDPVVDSALRLVGGLRWRGGSTPDPDEGWEIKETTTQGKPNDMARWLHEKGPEPGAESTMNCYDAVLLAAYQAGVVDKSWLKGVYANAATATRAALRDMAGSSRTNAHAGGYPKEMDPYGRELLMPTVRWLASLLASLHTGPLQRYRMDEERGIGGPDVPAGHLVFFNGVRGHVALSLGTRDGQGHQEVVSLWSRPRAQLPADLSSDDVGVMQVTTVEDLLAHGAGRTVEFAAPAWSAGSAREGRPTTVPAPDARPTAHDVRNGNPPTTKRPSERAGPRPEGERAGADLTEKALTTMVDAAKAEAERRLTQETARSPWRLPPETQETCLIQLRALADELFPWGIASTGTVDDRVLPTEPSTRRLLERPDDWTPVAAWQPLFREVEKLGIGGAALVVEGRPGAIGHAFAIVNTKDGLRIADPRNGGVTLADPAGQRAPFQVRALLVDATGRAVRYTRGTVPAPRPFPTADAISDAADPRVGTHQPGQNPRPHVEVAPDGTLWISSRISAEAPNRACVEVALIRA